MITRSFIEKVHDTFDELNYRETKHLNADDFEKSAVRTLTHCKDLIDAINVVHLYQFCLKKWDKIEKMFKRKLQAFNEYNYEGNSLVSVVSDNEAFGTFYVTNGINESVEQVFVASHSFDEGIFALGFKHGKFSVFEDGKYYIKYAKMSSSKMKLFDKSGNCLCNIVLSKDLGIFLENNLTPYELVIYEDFVGIYDRTYIESLAKTDIIDTNKLLADIEWDMLDKNSNFGVAKLIMYATLQNSELSKSNEDTNNKDLEMFLLFATSTFLVFQKYIKAQKNLNALTMMALWS